MGERFLEQSELNKLQSITINANIDINVKDVMQNGR